MSGLRSAAPIPFPALSDGLHTPGRSRNRARRQGNPLCGSLASLASLDRSARLRRQAFHGLVAQSRLFCRLLSTKAAESQRPHRVVVVTRRGGTNVKQRRRRLITTGRCGPEKLCARRSREVGRRQPEGPDEGRRAVENIGDQQQSVAPPSPQPFPRFAGRGGASCALSAPSPVLLPRAAHDAA
jgi:hypothetical protein